MQFCGRRKYLGHFSSSFKAHFLFHTWSLSLLFHKHFGANFVGWFPSVPNLVQARNIFFTGPIMQNNAIVAARPSELMLKAETDTMQMM